MSYLHIDNLYKSQEILLFKECYALEKIHGTSAHISYNGEEVKFFAGGGNHKNFVALFDVEALKARFNEIMTDNVPVTVYGESYGGKQQGMSRVYGVLSKFIGFEVKIGELWLNVPKACSFVERLGLEFVYYERILTTLEAIDAQRDALSVQAFRNGMGEHPREGIVLHPLEEVTLNNGQRVIAKYKTEAYQETKTPRKVSNEQLAVLSDARAVASEWVTHERLNHILTSGKVEARLESTGEVIKLMLEDILREGSGEIIDSQTVRKEVGRAIALIFKESLRGLRV